MKIAFITGVTGQDGSYLAELLLSKGYKVVGLKRRTSLICTDRIDHLLKNQNFKLEYHDLNDVGSLYRLLLQYKPDEFYNLAAQSHVKVSFDVPENTIDGIAMGTMRILEAIRNVRPECKFYQASSSEMFGDNPNYPYNEDSKFMPASPYANAKLFAHNLMRNYRKSYNMFCCSGILFNHESILKNSPVMIRRNNIIDILPIEDIFRSESHRYEGILDTYVGAEVWNGTEWTKILGGTCYQDKNKKTRIVQTINSCIETTLEHDIFMHDNSEKANSNISVGDKLFKIEFPTLSSELEDDHNFVSLLGFIAGDGHVSAGGRIRLIGKDLSLLQKYADKVTKKYGWSYRISEKISPYKSRIYIIDVCNDTNFGKWIRTLIYTKGGEKRVPAFILNSSVETKTSFFEGYYDADGRKAGHEKYKWKGFTTNSATLSLGLISIMKQISPTQEAKCKCEYRSGRRYYYIQFTTPQKSGNKGNHRIKDRQEVIKITEADSTDGWFFDIQTESQTFASGANLCKIHNSPRRGETFVTRKISIGVAKIALGLENKLVLGNLDAYRDWGFAGDYVEAMWLMLQVDTPDDYVISTGKTYSVRDFCKLTFEYAGLGDYTKYVIQDPKYFRPHEVPYLLGNSEKAKQNLNWEPKTNIKELCEMMYDHDYRRLK